MTAKVTALRYDDHVLTFLSQTSFLLSKNEFLSLQVPIKFKNKLKTNNPENSCK